MTQLKIINIVAVAVSVMEGCCGDYTSYTNYYPEYSFNYSAPTISNSQKRIFSDEISLGKRTRTKNDKINGKNFLLAAASVGISFDASIPLDDLNSAIYISVPFSFSLPEAVSTKSDGYGTGRSLSAVGPSRSSMYKSLEGYVARMTGSDGHACLLRAMCETSATPLHDDGLIGENGEL